jgi:hypothetical protein
MYRLLVSKIRRAGECMYKIKLIDTQTGESYVLANPIVTLDQLKVLEQQLANQCKLNNKLFISKNYRQDA